MRQEEWFKEWQSDLQVPGPLWQSDEIGLLVRSPADWLRICESREFTENGHGGIGSVLVDSGFDDSQVEVGTWIGRDLGEFWIDGMGTINPEDCHDGSVTDFGGQNVYFFVDLKEPLGSDAVHVEVDLGFLRFWDAFPTVDGYNYVDAEGETRPLMRWSLDGDRYVEVRVLELKQYLATTGRTLVKQFEYFLVSDLDFRGRIDSKKRVGEGVYSVVLTDYSDSGRSSLSILMGYQLIHGVENRRKPRLLSGDGDEDDYPEFVIGLDPETLIEELASCDPVVLSESEKEGGPGYLDLVFFAPTVLDKYCSDPQRYRVTETSLSCYNLWAIDFSKTSTGQIWLYLGDLGKRLPSRERAHWKMYNTYREGLLEPGKIRRDLLGQWASSPDFVRDVENRIGSINEVSVSQGIGCLWKEPGERLSARLGVLVGPRSAHPTSLDDPVLILTKWLVDGLDVRVLKGALVGEVHPNSRGLQLLKQFCEERSCSMDLHEVLHGLQAVRSRGGVAHRENSDSMAAYRGLGLSGADAISDFEIIKQKVLHALILFESDLEEMH